MKILQVMGGAQNGGAETFYMDSLRALCETDIKQYALVRPQNTARIEEIHNLDVPFKTAPFNKHFKFPTKKILKSIENNFQPDITQYWMGRAGTMSIKSDGVNLAWYGGYYKPGRFKHADGHVAVTRDIADHIVAQGVPHDKVFVLHTYAEFKKETPVKRSDFDTPEDVPLLLALSRLHWKKGLDVLLESLVNVPDAHLWIAGDGPLEADLKKHCHNLGLDNRVRFLGWRDDRGALLEACDVCVFPSRYEPFGTVTVEAWGCKRPLIAAKSAGPKATVTHGTDGLLVEIDAIDELTDAINSVITDSKLAKSLVKGGLKSYNEGFSKAVFKQKAQDFYTHALSLK